MLGQSELTILVEAHLPSKIFQGITTEVTGEGGSAAPLSDAMVAEDRLGYEHMGITADWRTFGQYFATAGGEVTADPFSMPVFAFPLAAPFHTGATMKPVDIGGLARWRPYHL